jgi:cholesterol transport system auxiliary component
MKHHEYFSATTAFYRRSRWVVWISGAIPLTLAFTFCGCVSRPALNNQTFAFSIPALPATNGVPNGRVLEIRILQIAPPFDGRSLIYRTGEFSYQRDPYAEFLGLPAEGMVGPVSEMLRRDGGFSEVVQPGSAAKPDTFVEITINQLYGDIRKPRSPYAVMAMQLTFMDATKGLPGKVIIQRNYSSRIPMNLTTPAALMEGWNQALVGILAEAASDFRNRESEGKGYETNGGSLTQKSAETP